MPNPSGSASRTHCGFASVVKSRAEQQCDRMLQEHERERRRHAAEERRLQAALDAASADLKRVRTERTRLKRRAPQPSAPAPAPAIVKRRPVIRRAVLAALKLAHPDRGAINAAVQTQVCAQLTNILELLS